MILTNCLLQTSISPSLVAVGTAVLLALVVGVIILLFINQKNIFENKQRIQEIETKHQKVLLLASLKIQEDQRNKLAADLHDDAGPLLATARLYLSENLVNMEPMEQRETIVNARNVIDSTIQLIRNLSHNLLPPTLKNFGLESAIADFLNKINQSNKIKAVSHFKNYTERFDHEREINIFRIVQELIANILKYSEAGYIHISQNNANNSFYLRIVHDGKGLTQDQFQEYEKSTNGLGLKNISGRVKVLRGSIRFDADSEDQVYKTTLIIPYLKESIAESIYL
jgi:two-component system, NarL family, sensor kinase